VQTRWVVDTVVSAQASVDPGHEAYVKFDGTGGFTGSTGCTPVEGTAVITSEQITVVVAGAPECSDGRRLALHSAILATLHGEVKYQVRWQSLTLSGPAGVGLTLRATA
jgi:heat shock protein HslJ